MNKKEISELKKQFTPDNCTISRICGCYVDSEKEKRLDSARGKGGVARGGRAGAAAQRVGRPGKGGKRCLIL